MNNMKKYIIILFLVIIGGCSVGPDYQKPDLDIPKDFFSDDSLKIKDSLSLAVADTSWWSLFNDPKLTELINTAIKENSDILMASARIEQYLGLYGVSKADMYPQINGQLSGKYGQNSSVNTGTDKNPSRATFNVGISADWEIDLWGKIRRSNESARAELLAAEESKRGIVLYIASQVAFSYIDLLALKTQLQITKNTIDSREYSLFLFRLRRAQGDLSDLELAQLESEYWTARAKLPQIEKSIVQVETAISILIGKNPQRIETDNILDSLSVPDVPSGIPSKVLERRPDIRQAEQKLISANAKIGVVKAMYYPSISLSGLLGLASNDLTTILDPSAYLWNVAGNITAPIFTGGKISSQVEVAEAVKKELLQSYISTVRNAFRESENAFSDRVFTQEQLELEAKMVESLELYKSLADMRYNEGVSSYLEVLDAERSLFSAQLEYVNTKSILYKSIVNIYKVLAGGWVDKLNDNTVK